MIKQMLLIAGLLVSTSARAADTVTCGDTDGDGLYTLLKPVGSDDRDCDGYTVAEGDCDDTDRFMFPGEWSTSGCSAGEAKQCTSGTFGACQADPCESTGSGNCRYIDCTSGNDTTGNGTAATPWKTFDCIGSHYAAGDRPACWTAPAAGDVIYLKGTCNQTWRYRDSDAATEYLVMFRGVDGTSADPIRIKGWPGYARPTITSPSNNAAGVYLLQSSHINVSALLIDGVEGNGVLFEETDDSKVEATVIRNVDGGCASGGNSAGVHISGDPNTGNSVVRSKILDVTDDGLSGGTTNPNCSNIVVFRGSNLTIAQNELSYTAAITDTANSVRSICFKQKHAQSTTSIGNVFEGNVVWNCLNYAVQIGGENWTIENNLVVNSSQGLSFEDVGGTTHLGGYLVRYNTFANSGIWDMQPSDNAAYSFITGNFTFEHNILTDSAASYSADTGIVRVDNTGDNATYTDVVTGGKLSFSNNCYYNPSVNLTSTDSFNLFAGGESSGQRYNFATWQAFGYDAGSYNSNPSLDAYYVAQSTDCNDKGWLQVSAITSKGQFSPVSRRF